MGSKADRFRSYFAAVRFALTLGCTVLLAAVATSACSNDSKAVPGGEVAVGDSAVVMSAATGDTIEVWKDPSCGCCKSWIEHMQKHGFTVIAHDDQDMTKVKQARGIGADLVSCHTAMIHGYAVEGHVPADLVRKMITEKPKIAGLAVPGMPMGSPGMESMGMKDKYDVIAFNADGTRQVYASR